jgi:hypothetical protein
MKTKDSLLKMLIVSLLLISIIWELALFVTSPGHRLAELPKQIVLIGMLFWTVSIFFKQNQDDDDWAF